MFINRQLSKRHLVAWLTRDILWLLLFNSLVAVLYAHQYIPIAIPWLPVSVIGTAVAFFVGFKNNQAYDRVWEARKIWGGIINDSRSWGMMIMGLVRPFDEGSKGKIDSIRKQLVYRHLAWIYAHRQQLLEPMVWEPVGASSRERKRAERFDRKFGLGTLENDVRMDNLVQFISDTELSQMRLCKNLATQLINQQSLAISELQEMGYINDFRQMQLTEVLRNLYTLQGQNERIKKFPFPRDYSTMSKFLVLLFTLLVPFSLTPELMKLGHSAFWLSIPISSLVGLVFVIMEDLGDYNENPFMGTPNSMPMLSICRTIENDLKEMLGEKNIPPAISATGGVLM